MEIHVNSYGTSLRVKDGILNIKRDDNFNQIPLEKIKSISLTRGVQISTDVIYRCLELGIDLLILERNGYPMGRLWNNRFGSISTIRKSQMDYSRGPQILPWVVANIREKIRNQEELLMTFMSLDEPHEDHIYRVCGELTAISTRLEECKVMEWEEGSARIRALEGQCAKKYFQCVNLHLPFKHQFTKRSKRPARDMTNSMLNYCYGMLYSHLESALIKSGLDPFIGFFHRDEYNRPVLTYDIIEPFRPWADWVVFHLCLNEVMEESFFELSDGGYWLLGEGKRILIQHFVDFFEEIIDYEGNHFSRFIQLERRAQLLVKIIKENESN